jgi:hypothetical protein
MGTKFAIILLIRLDYVLRFEVFKEMKNLIVVF